MNNQQVLALFTAEGARFRPMRMMIGPVTTGGRKRMTFFTPTSSGGCFFFARSC